MSGELRSYVHTGRRSCWRSLRLSSSWNLWPWRQRSQSGYGRRSKCLPSRAVHLFPGKDGRWAWTSIELFIHASYVFTFVSFSPVFWHYANHYGYALQHVYYYTSVVGVVTMCHIKTVSPSSNLYSNAACISPRCRCEH